MQIINDVIENNTPYKLVKDVEPFINQYTGNISYDYSGDVEKIKKNDLKEILKSNDYDFIYSSQLDKLLSEVYIDQWVASYESNRGKNWISYKCIVEENYDNWKYEFFDIFDEDGDYIIDNEINTEYLEEQLDDILESFIREQSLEIYYARILKTIS